MAKIKLTNQGDQSNARRGLGLPEIRRRPVRLADGTIREFPLVSELYIEILGRGMACDAIAVPTNTLLIGQIPLEMLDLVVDPKSRDLAVNPESPDAPMFDAMRAA